MKAEIKVMNLNQFTPQELMHAGDILKAYASFENMGSEEEIHLCLNEGNRKVYLLDGRGSILMLDGMNRLRVWLCCPTCNTDGFEGEIVVIDGTHQRREFMKHDGYCSENCWNASSD